MPETPRPYNQEAEQSVLGAALQNVQAALETGEGLQIDDFYNRHHAEIFAAIAELALAGKPVDIVSVSEVLGRRGTLEVVGGQRYLAELGALVPAPSNILHYIEIVREYSTRRRLMEACEDIAGKCHAGEDEGRSIVDYAEQLILDIGTRSKKEDYTPISDVLAENMAKIEERSKLPFGELTGLTTGIRRLDDLTNGLQPSELIILAAPPGQGKTSFALNIALNAALKKQAVIMIFSIEMSKTLLAERLQATQAEISLNLLRSGKVLKDTRKTMTLSEATAEIAKTKIFVADHSGIQIGEIRNMCRRLAKREGKLDLVVIDYLQLMNTGTSLKSQARPENRNQEIAVLTRMLKQLAREMNCPVLVLSQLSREGAKKGAPSLSDLRDSGAIEQDADIVMFINENKPQDGEGPAPDTTRILDVAKHRNGATEKITVRWLKEFTKFSNYDASADAIAGIFGPGSSAPADSASPPAAFPPDTDEPGEPTAFPPEDIGDEE